MVLVILLLVLLGDGYVIAEKLGHSVLEIKPGLVPLECYERNLAKELQGLSLRNVSIKLVDRSSNKKIYEDFGEMLFTHFGVSGPVIISASSHLVRYKGIEKLFEEGMIELVIDLKPALDSEKLDLRIRRDFEGLSNKKFKNSLDKLLPQKMISAVIRISKIDEEKKVNEITREERRALGELIKNFAFKIKGFRGIEEAIVTSRRG